MGIRLSVKALTYLISIVLISIVASLTISATAMADDISIKTGWYVADANGNPINKSMQTTKTPIASITNGSISYDTNKFVVGSTPVSSSSLFHVYYIYGNQDSVATYLVEGISGHGYKDAFVGTFTITSASTPSTPVTPSTPPSPSTPAPVKIPVANLTISAPAQTYTGSAVQAPVTVKYGNTVLSKDSDYTLSYLNNKNAGTATVTVTGKGNYIGTKSVKFKINKANIKNAKLSDITDRLYTGQKVTPSVKVTLGSNKLNKGRDFKVTYTNNKKIGTATATVTGKGNYTGTKKVKFKIRGNIAKANIDPIKVQNYTGNSVKPALTVELDGKTLKKGRDYKVAWSKNKKIGVASVKIIGINKYMGEQKINFGIAPHANGAEYRQQQGNGSNCGATSFIVGVNILLGKTVTKNNVGVWIEMDRNTTKDLEIKGTRWLNNHGYGAQLKCYRKNPSVVTAKDLANELLHGHCVILCANSKSRWKKADGSYQKKGAHASGHWVVFYCYDPATKTYYCNDSSSAAGELGAGEWYSDGIVKGKKVSEMTDWLNNRVHQSTIVLAKKK